MRQLGIIEGSLARTCELLKLRQAIDKPAGYVGRPIIPSTLEMQRGIPVVRP